MLPRFLARHPEVRVALSIENRDVDLLAEGFDLAIRIGPLPDSELIARRLTAFGSGPAPAPPTSRRAARRRRRRTSARTS
jgi:DNA-binding transcriptional LysR family regulator